MSVTRVLFVDDEENILKALKRIFKRKPWEIHTAKSGREALDLADSVGYFDVVLSDQRMPGMTGVELLTAFRHKSPSTVRMILSGFADVESILDAINEGFVYKFILKSAKEEVLYESLCEVVNAVEARRENKVLSERLASQEKELSSLDVIAGELESIEFDLGAKPLLHSALDALPFPLVVTDPAGAEVFCNKAAREKLAFGDAENVEELIEKAGGFEKIPFAVGADKNPAKVWMLR